MESRTESYMVYGYGAYGCRALIGQQYGAYGYGTLILRAAEDASSQARASSNLDQLDAVSAFNQNLRSGRLATLIKRPNDQLQHVVADQSDSLRPAVKAGMQARTQALGLYGKSVHDR